MQPASPKVRQPRQNSMAFLQSRCLLRRWKSSLALASTVEATFDQGTGRGDSAPGRLLSPTPSPAILILVMPNGQVLITGRVVSTPRRPRGIPATRGNTPRRSGEQLHWWQLRAPSYAGTRAQLSMPYVVPLQVQPTTERDRRAIQLAGTRAHTTLMHQDPRNLSDIRVGCSCIPTARWARSHVSLLPL